jgi:putative membrane protein
MKLPVLLILIVSIALIISGIAPYDRLTWLMEVAPVFIAAPFLIRGYRTAPLDNSTFVVNAIHVLVLILGGAYTYARVPLGEWMQQVMQLDRNPYDKIGHFLQGFTPAFLAFEILPRMGLTASRRMMIFIAISAALAVSAVYELIEWAAALLLGQGADEFLGMQGDMWDTQSDMFMALIGAVSAVVLRRAVRRSVGQ